MIKSEKFRYFSIKSNTHPNIGFYGELRINTVKTLFFFFKKLYEYEECMITEMHLSYDVAVILWIMSCHK